MKNLRGINFTGLFIIFLSLLLSAFIVFKTASPIKKSTLIIAPRIDNSDELFKGDILMGSFICEYDHLDSVEIGLCYDDNDSNIQNTIVNINIVKNDSVELLSISLPLNAFPNGEFLKLSTDSYNCKDSLINISISNESEDMNYTPFSVLTAEDSDYLSNLVYHYSLNGAEKNGLLAFRSNYTDGYSLYMPLTYAFFILLIGISAVSILNKRQNK